MPKLPKDDEAAIREVLRLQGMSDKSADTVLRHIQAGSEAEAASTAAEMQQEVLEGLKAQGGKFTKAEILEFLGSDGDEIPPEFEELLANDDA